MPGDANEVTSPERSLSSLERAKGGKPYDDASGGWGHRAPRQSYFRRRGRSVTPRPSLQADPSSIRGHGRRFGLLGGAATTVPSSLGCWDARPSALSLLHSFLEDAMGLESVV